MAISGLTVTAVYAAAQPPDTVTSDAGQNTTAGNHSLFNLGPLRARGSCNTASNGFDPGGLGFGCTPCGGGNTALGAYSLATDSTGHNVKTDPGGTIQYGLIAEEVDKVYPELVICDEAGTLQGVRYDELAPMLLDELQKDEAKIDSLKSSGGTIFAGTTDSAIQRAAEQIASEVVKVAP